MFKPIEKYDNKYKINESGIILNKKNHVIKPAQSEPGYLRVALEKYDENGKLISRTNECVHRLVAQAFIPNPDNLPVVMHLDNDKMNNHVSNLQWGTYQDNTQQAVDDEIFGTKSDYRTVYELYNEDTSVFCYGGQGLEYKTGYPAKTAVGYATKLGQKIGDGPYKGYKVRATGQMVRIIHPISFNRKK